MLQDVKLTPLDLNNPDQIGWMFKVRTHQEVTKYMLGEPPATFLQHTQYLYGARHKQFHIIHSNQTLLGYCQSTDYEHEIELGWALHPLYWRQGIGALAVDLLVYKMKDLKKNLILFVKKNNQRALNLYKKHHFIIEENYEHLEQFKMKYDYPT